MRTCKVTLWTPGPRDMMTQVDRTVLALAKHMPGVARLASRTRRVPPLAALAGSAQELEDRLRLFAHF